MMMMMMMMMHDDDDDDNDAEGMAEGGAEGVAGEAFCKGTQYTSHPVSHAALPEAGASKNLTLQAKELGYYLLAGLTVPSRHS